MAGNCIIKARDLEKSKERFFGREVLTPGISQKSGPRGSFSDRFEQKGKEIAQ
jgi:hypothetical protein